VLLHRVLSIHNEVCSSTPTSFPCPANDFPKANLSLPAARDSDAQAKYLPHSDLHNQRIAFETRQTITSQFLRVVSFLRLGKATCYVSFDILLRLIQRLAWNTVRQILLVLFPPTNMTSWGVYITSLAQAPEKLVLCVAARAFGEM